MAKKKKLSAFSEGLSVSTRNPDGTVVSSLQRANRKAANGESGDHGRVSNSCFGASRSVKSCGPPSGRSLRTPVTQLLIGDPEDG
jgi:hypothetical protein